MKRNVREVPSLKFYSKERSYGTMLLVPLHERKYSNSVPDVVNVHAPRDLQIQSLSQYWLPWVILNHRLWATVCIPENIQ